MSNRISDFFIGQLKSGPLFQRRLKRVRSFQDMGDEQIARIENEMLLDQIQNAYKKSRFYRNLYDEYGVNMHQIQHKGDLNVLPAISKFDVKSHEHELYIGSPIRYRGSTSGTSGTPLTVFYSLDCVWNEASYNEIFRNNAGHYYGDRAISLRGKLDASSFEHYDRTAHILYLSSYLIYPSNAVKYYERIKNFQPKSIFGYPSALEALAVIFRQHDLKVQIPLTFTSSETLYPHQRELIENQFNTKIFDRYGNAERTISLVQYAHHGPYIAPKLYSVNEYSERDRILTTNLINPQFPLIRYVVDDALEWDEKGNILRIAGRIDDRVKTPDGRIVGSAALSLVFKQVPKILITQVIQNTLDEIVVRLVVEDSYSEEDAALLKKAVAERLGTSLNVRYEYVDQESIIKTDRNKYKLVISSLEDA